MINTDLLPGAPVCFDLVVDYIAYTATTGAIWIIFIAAAFLFMKAVAADGRRAVTGTHAVASLISSQNPSLVPYSITLVGRRKGTSTVVAVLLPFGQGEGGGV